MPPNAACERQIMDARPKRVRWCAKNVENFDKLVNFSLSWEKDLVEEHFCHNATERPHVDGRAIAARSKEKLRRPVIERHNQF